MKRPGDHDCALNNKIIYFRKKIEKNRDNFNKQVPPQQVLGSYSSLKESTWPTRLHYGIKIQGYKKGLKYKVTIQD